MIEIKTTPLNTKKTSMDTAPRISSTQLQQYIGQRVRIVGKILSEEVFGSLLVKVKVKQIK